MKKKEPQYMHTIERKNKMDWTRPGRRRNTKNGYSKENGGEAEKRKKKTVAVLDVDRCIIDSIKKRPSSERSGDFDQLNLLRK